MFPALSRFLVPFVAGLKANGRVGCWYSSVKNDDGKPSFRAYFEVAEQDEKSILSDLEEFLRRNREQMGWTGKFHSPDPEFNPCHPDLHEIIQACEITLDLAKRFRSGDRRRNEQFWQELERRVKQGLASMGSVHHCGFVHFIANNLVMSDFSLAHMIGIEPRT